MRFFFRKYFPISLKDALIFIVTMLAASLLCEFLRNITTSDVHVPLIFVLVVLIISFLTNGYFFGTLAAISSVFAVNWAFTYPYRKLDFSIYGYPLTFITMLAVGIATSTLATRLKEQEKLKLENEREKMRANLLRSVSHDIRTPLTAIGGNIETVLEGGEKLPEDEKRALLENAKEDVNWLYTMVENLLSITKINTEGKSEIKKSDELIEEIFSESSAKFRRHHDSITIKIHCPDEPVFVYADAMLIEQVLINLMENAVKHGVSTDEIDLDAAVMDDMVEIKVTDNGQGIDKKILPNIFSISTQNQVFSPDKNRFMGIGLMVCKTIVDAHGGDMSARNVQPHGAEFSFTVPLGGTEYADKRQNTDN